MPAKKTSKKPHHPERRPPPDHGAKYAAPLAFRPSIEADDKVRRTAKRLGVDYSQILRWWVDEMPEAYVPKKFTLPTIADAKTYRSKP